MQPALIWSALSVISLMNAQDRSAGPPLWHIKGMNLLQTFPRAQLSSTPPHAFPASHYKASLLKVAHCCFWPSFDAFLVFYGADSFTIVFSQRHSYKHLHDALAGLTAPNKMAGSLDVEYPWPVTLQWPEEVMSGENVPGRQTFQTDQVVPPWDFLSCLSYVCPSG